MKFLLELECKPAASDLKSVYGEGRGLIVWCNSCFLLVFDVGFCSFLFPEPQNPSSCQDITQRSTPRLVIKVS